MPDWSTGTLDRNNVITECFGDGLNPGTGAEFGFGAINMKANGARTDAQYLTDLGVFVTGRDITQALGFAD